MLSMYPQSPARGRSRFSKALPVPPGSPTLPPLPQSPGWKQMSAPSTPLEAAEAPPLPARARATTTISIPRRHVGVGVGGERVQPPSQAKAPSVSSSVYSESPGIPKRFSDSSTSDTKDSLSAVDSGETRPTLPQPPKVTQRQPDSNPIPPQPAYNDLARPPSSFQSSPPRPEIWKRRSVKSDKSISFKDLKLDWSNGSTASPPRKQEPSADRPPLPRSLAGRKPVPSRPAPHQPDLMGGKLAKLKNKLLRDWSEKSTTPPKDGSPAPSHQYGAFKRLPTPEALDTDEKKPPVPHVLSPTSPDTPPVDTPIVPQKSESRNLVSASKALESAHSPNLLAQHSRQSSETLTVTSEPTVMQSPQPQKAFAARILTPQQSPDKTSPLSLPSPAASGKRFPRLPQLASPGTVMPAPPLTEQQYDCYQSHKYMRGARNVICPVACMICGRKDKEQRWRCTWCYLSACGSCMKVLTSTPERDLRRCTERIRR